MKSDSIGYDCVYQYTLFKQVLDPNSYEVRIFSKRFDSKRYNIPLEPIETLYSILRTSSDPIIVYHFCDGWDEFESEVEKARCRLVVRWHNNTPPWFFGRLSSQYTYRSIDAFKTVIRLARNPNVYFWCNSHFTAKQLSLVCGDNVRFSVIYPATPFLENGTSHSYGSQAQPAPQQNDPLLLFVSRLTPNKGHKTVLSVASYVQRYLNRSVAVAFPGRPDGTSYAKELADLAASLKVTLTLPGEVDQDELTQFYSEAAVFCCFSEHEGFGLPVYEAARMGVPVVGWANTALAESLQHHPLATSERNIKSFAAACITAMNPEVRAQTIEWQYEHMVNLYSKSTIAQQVEESIKYLFDNSCRGASNVLPSSSHAHSAEIEAIRSRRTRIESEMEALEPHGADLSPREVNGNYVTAYDIELYDRLVGDNSLLNIHSPLFLHPSSFTCRNVTTSNSDDVSCYLRGRSEYVIYGPYIKLPTGNYIAEFDLNLEDVARNPKGYLKFEFVSGTKVHSLSFRHLWRKRRDSRFQISFIHTKPNKLVELRIYANSASLGTLVFKGVRVTRVSSFRDIARFISLPFRMMC